MVLGCSRDVRLKACSLTHLGQFITMLNRHWYYGRLGQLLECYTQSYPQKWWITVGDLIFPLIPAYYCSSLSSFPHSFFYPLPFRLLPLHMKPYSVSSSSWNQSKNGPNLTVRTVKAGVLSKAYKQILSKSLILTNNIRLPYPLKAQLAWANTLLPQFKNVTYYRYSSPSSFTLYVQLNSATYYAIHSAISQKYAVLTSITHDQ